MRRSGLLIGSEGHLHYQPLEKTPTPEDPVMSCQIQLPHPRPLVKEHLLLAMECQVKDQASLLYMMSHPLPLDYLLKGRQLHLYSPLR